MFLPYFLFFPVKPNVPTMSTKLSSLRQAFNLRSIFFIAAPSNCSHLLSLLRCNRRGYLSARHTSARSSSHRCVWPPLLINGTELFHFILVYSKKKKNVLLRGPCEPRRSATSTPATLILCAEDGCGGGE